MTLEDRTAGLLDLVEGERERRCRAIRDAAASQARALLADARRAARQRVRDAIAAERTQAEARIGAATARLQTARRLARQRKAHALLDLAWAYLPQALAARWRDDQARAGWAAQTLTAALAALPRGEWRIDHAPGPKPDELAALADSLAKQGIAATFGEDAALPGGLRIRAGGNLVDGTIGGLLADRNAIGARVLCAMEEGP